MGTIWIREFTGGLDARRLPETSAGGLLIKAQDGHITRGGEFEQRAAFVPFGDVSGTVGLAHDAGTLVVFGSGEAPIGLPAGVAYQQLLHDDDPEPPDLVRIRSFDLYAGNIYVAAEFEGGDVLHFYDGERVEFWFDGRARAQFTIVSAEGSEGGVDASGYIQVVDIIGTAPSTVTISSITVGATELLAAPLVYTLTGFSEDYDQRFLAYVIQQGVDDNHAVSGFRATRDAATPTVVTITTDDPSADFNGEAIVVDFNPAEVTITNGVMNGGVDPADPILFNILIDGVGAMLGPLAYEGDLVAFAAAIAVEINGRTGITGFEAESEGATVSITAVDPGAAQTNKFVQFVRSGVIVFDPATQYTANGIDNAEPPGTFVKTIGKKMYSAAGPNLFFSGINQPTMWTTDATGAGFIDMSTESSGSEELLAFARYQQLVAIFSATVIQTWYMDPDPALNRIAQTLNNTGTISGASVTQFGDSDLFYLDESGIRSLRARDSSSAAATTDIGIPVDPLVLSHLETLTELEKSRIIGLIEPRDGRFWLIAKNKIFVFSFFGGAKVSAWSIYLPTILVEGETVEIPIDYATVFNKRVYVRSGDGVYVYGGTGPAQTYDATVAEAWLPYLDADKPTEKKAIRGIDASIRGTWAVSASLSTDPDDLEIDEEIATISKPTFPYGRIPYEAEATHISLRFRSSGAGPHKLASTVIHFETGGDED